MINNIGHPRGGAESDLSLKHWFCYRQTTQLLPINHNYNEVSDILSCFKIRIHNIPKILANLVNRVFYIFYNQVLARDGACFPKNKISVAVSQSDLRILLELCIRYFAALNGGAINCLTQHLYMLSFYGIQVDRKSKLRP